MVKKTAPKKQPSPATTTVQVTPITQGGHTMYAFVIDSAILRKICTVSRREEDKEKGYQRHLQESRLRQVARYVDEKGGAIPNNILVDFYDAEVSLDAKHMTLTFPSDRKCAWIIDGQHRLFGFDFAKASYPLLVVAFLHLTLEQEVDMFVTINTQQKRLPASLTIDLLGIIGSEADITTRCRELVAKLNEEEESPWYGRINMTGEASGAISLVNFVRKLKPLISETGILKSYSFNQQYGILVNFWKAIKATFADQWEDKSSLLNKTLGFGALMNFFPTILVKTLEIKAGEFTVTAVANTLSLLGDVQFDGDTLGSGSGNNAEKKGEQVLQRLLEAGLGTAASAGSSQGIKL